MHRGAIPGLSRRFQSKHYDDVYQIVDVTGEPGSDTKTYTVSDLHGKRTDLGFSQPVASDRLTPIEMLPTQAPSETVRTRISIHCYDGWKDGTIVAQARDG